MECRIETGDLSVMNGEYHNHTGTGVNIFSATDVSTLIEIARYQAIGNAGNAYMVVIAPGGIHYVIYFNGTHNELPAYGSYTPDQQDLWNFGQFTLQRDLLKDSNFYSIINNQKVLNSKGLEQIFFKTIEKMNLQNKVTLQKVEDNKALTINKNSDGTTTPVPCP